jgi:PAS domain S-box-containing protein
MTDRLLQGVPRRGAQRNANEARLRQLVELSSDFFWELDADHRCTFLSERHEAITGRPRAETLGKRPWELDYLRAPESVCAAQRANLDARRSFQNLELVLIDEHGRPRWVALSGEPAFDMQGRFVGFRGVGRDITGAKRAEQLLRLEHSIARCLADADDSSAALQAVLRAVCEAEGWECGRYWRWDEAAGALRFGQGWSVPGAETERFITESRDFTFAPGVGLAGIVLQSGEPLWAADVGEDARVKQRGLSQVTGIHGAFVFPVVSEGKTIGVVSISSRQVREPDERLLQAVRVIGSQLGQFLQRKQAESVLRESEERFRRLTELSSDWYWEQDPQFRFTRFDGMRIPTAPIVGRAPWEQQGFGLDAETLAAHRALLEARRPFRDLVYRYVQPDGRRRYVSVSGEPLFDAAGGFRGYRGVSKDVSVRVRSEKLIAWENQLLGELLRNAPLPDLLHAFCGGLDELLPVEGVCAILLRDSTGERLVHAAAPGLAPEFVAALEGEPIGPRGTTAAAAVHASTTVVSSDIDSDPLWRERRALASRHGLRSCWATPIVGAKGRAIGALVVYRAKPLEPYRVEIDLMANAARLAGVAIERREAEAEIRRLTAELEDRVEVRTRELRATIRELESFSYTISHDLRAPLRAIDGYTHMLLADFGPELTVGAQDLLGKVSGGARRMGRLIDGLLEFSRLREIEPTSAAVDMDALARAVAAELAPLVNPRAQVHIEPLPGTFGDEDLLRQVWVNLIGNALKFSARMPISRIDIRAIERAAEIQYDVRDNGAGFDMRYAGQLFGVFARLHRQEEFEGSGVGLAIVNRIVRRHGGRVWADGRPGEGATFHFVVPVQPRFDATRESNGGYTAANERDEREG